MRQGTGDRGWRTGPGMSWNQRDGLDDPGYVLNRLADHAHELRQGPGTLMLAGLGAAGQAATALACHTRDNGWPTVTRHLLLLPDPSVGSGLSVPGICDCTTILRSTEPAYLSTL